MDTIPKKNQIFVDETGINDNEVPAYGWNYSGIRAPGLTRGKKNERVSIAGMSRENEIQGSFILSGGFNGPAFVEFVKLSLLPNLKPNDVVIMDNASIHKGQEVRTLIENAGFKLIFQPPYSPDLNAIEHLWSPLKAKIRKRIEESILGEKENLFEITSKILKLNAA